MKSGDWRSVLAAYDAPNHFHEPLLVWVRPSRQMLEFIETQARLLTEQLTFSYYLFNIKKETLIFAGYFFEC
jgi:hypothetical protein